MNKTIFGVLIALLVLGLAQFASAAESGCFNVEIDVNDDQVKPGESFTVEVTVENNYTMDMDDDEDVDISIDSMDDGEDDYEDDGTVDQLDEDQDESIEFDVEVPYTIDEGNYDITVTVSGETTNGTECETVVNSTVEVKKDKHELILKQPTVSLETLKCSRTTEVTSTIYNIGDSDEDVELSVYNMDLGINQKQTFDLDSGNDEDDIKATKTFSLDLKNVEAGSYTFYVKAAYDDLNAQETQTFSLKVEDCATAKPATTTPVTTTTQPATTTPVTTTVAPIMSVPAIVQEDSFMEQYGSVVLLALAYLVVIIVGILLVVSLLKKR